MEILEIIFPLLAIALTGYITAKRNYISAKDGDSLAKVVFSVIIPSLLFINTAKATFPPSLPGDFLFSYYAGALLVFVISVGLAKSIFGYSSAEQSVFAMGATYSNAVIVGIPVCAYAIGDATLLPLFIIVSLHNLVLFTTAIIFAERDTLSASTFVANVADILKQLLSSPITGSLIAGAVVNIAGIPIFKPLDEAISLMSGAAIPCALFVLGSSLSRYSMHGHLAPACVIVVLKLLLLPLLVWILAFRVFTLDPVWAATALLTAAMPTGINAYIVSHKYRACEATIASGIVASTLCSILTLSLLIAYLKILIA